MNQNEPGGIHERKGRRDPGNFDVHHLAQISDGFTGAELEQAIVDALYHAFSEDRDVRTADVTAAVGRAVPLSRSQREVIERLRAWLREGRAQSASFAEAAQAEQAQVRLELN